MNTKLRQKPKFDFEKDFFKLMNNGVFRKTIENVTKQRNIKLVATEKKRNYLVSEPKYHTTKLSTETLLAVETRKNQIIGQGWIQPFRLSSLAFLVSSYTWRKKIIIRKQPFGGFLKMFMKLFIDICEEEKCRLWVCYLKILKLIPITFFTGIFLRFY